MFPAQDVLLNKKDQIIRLANLLKAVTYESLAQGTTVIFAENNSIYMKVNSKVMAVGNHLVHLENGVTIPLHRIVKIKFEDHI